MKNGWLFRNFPESFLSGHRRFVFQLIVVVAPGLSSSLLPRVTLIPNRYSRDSLTRGYSNSASRKAGQALQGCFKIMISFQLANYLIGTLLHLQILKSSHFQIFKFSNYLIVESSNCRIAGFVRRKNSGIRSSEITAFTSLISWMVRSYRVNSDK